MRYAEAPPHPRLRPFIRTAWSLAGPGAHLPPQPVMPDGCTELIVHRGQPFRRHHAGGADRQARALFVGQMLAPVVLSPTGDADIVAIRFEPFGAHALLGFDQNAAVDQILDATAIDQPWLTRAIRSAEGAESADVAVAILEAALLKRLDLRDARRGASADARVQAAAGAMIQSDGALRIDRAAAIAGLSPRQLERMFKTHIGVSPKRFARVLRFQAAASRILATEPGSLADVSADAGFFDQAHMIRDFVTFAGTTPTAFAKQLGELTRMMLS